MQRTEMRVNEYEAVVETRCDLCGADMPQGYSKDGSDVEVSMRVSEDYGAAATTVAVDICVACFRDKLIPWLLSKGVEPRVTKATY